MGLGKQDKVTGRSERRGGDWTVGQERLQAEEAAQPSFPSPSTSLPRPLPTQGGTTQKVGCRGGEKRGQGGDGEKGPCR